MKKLLLSAIALAAFCNANAQLSESGKVKGDIRVAPKEFCYDGKVKLIMKEYDAKTSSGIFKIYDSNFEVEKTVNLNLGEKISKTIYQRRHYGTPVVEYYDDQRIDQVATWEEAKAYIGENYSEKKEVYQLWPNEEHDYYRFETFGNTCPNYYFYWNPEDKTIYYRRNYYKETYTGDWYNYDEHENTATIEPQYFEFIDFDNNRCVEDGFCFSQTLFNNDEKYEALVPKFSQKEVISNEIDEDGDGIIDHRTISVSEDRTGFSVVSEDGTELYSIETDFAFYLNDALVKINGKLYITAGVYNDDEEDCIFFEINRETSSIKQVAKLKGMRVSPTIAEQTDNITVELGEGSNAKEIVVVNGNGQVVKQIPVKNGERQITINAGSLNRGLNILNARGAKGNNNCKIIVK